MQITEAALDLVPKISGPRTVLSVGSGPDELKRWDEEGYTVVRLDIEPRTNPDICASMTDMGEIGPYDVVFCCHALEHLYPHEVVPALQEFHRVLKPGGSAVILVPDLEDVKPTEDVLDYPECGPITGLHLYYGDAAQIKEFPYMAHHCGFVKETLKNALNLAGFTLATTERLSHYNLAGIGVKA
jgi:SAM-dependent methyltransferase